MHKVHAKLIILSHFTLDSGVIHTNLPPIFTQSPAPPSISRQVSL